MTDTRIADAPVVVEEKSRRRRAVGIISSAALGTALLAGLTLAAFTDAEFAGLNDNGTDKPGYGVAAYNIQIRDKDPNGWVDTTMLADHDSDNTSADVNDPILLVIDKADKIIPGDSTTYPSVSFQVRNSDASTVNSSIYFRLINRTGGSVTTDTDLLAALRFNVTINNGQTDTLKLQDKTFDELDDQTTTLVSASATPGAVFTITIQVKLPDQGSPAANGLLQSTHAYLIAAVDGTSVAA
ncbi:MAG: hypothetical protein LBK54_04185 [Propionibacteriaceae bacterium]|jgi:hypothetical protein|nr:hypothetical protein [Propionibacteriaceae bacterium]